jgi:glycine cleavage system H protein
VGTSGYTDIFATKGMEYIFILFFIVVLVFFWRFLSRAEGPEISKDAADSVGKQSLKRFRLPKDLFYHQGHGWVKLEPQDTVRIGVDDFVQKLIGRASFIDLPRVGAFLKQGEKGWKMGGESISLDVLSPVDGEVLAVNDRALQDPQAVNRDPYGSGWLLKVRVPKTEDNTVHLLSGEPAEAWMKETVEAFSRRMLDDPDLAARIRRTAGIEIAGAGPRKKWNDLAQEFLSCE